VKAEQEIGDRGGLIVRRYIALLGAFFLAGWDSPSWAITANSLIMKSNGSNSGNDWILADTGFVGTYITLASPGSVTIDVEAQGIAAAGINPRMNIVVNDESRGWDVPSGFGNYQHTFDLPAGTHFVRTEFANDHEKSSRQLQVRQLNVTGATLANANTDANALAASDTYIENYRKGNVTVHLAGATPGSTVHVNLKNHAFNFGTAVAGTNSSTLMNANPTPGSNAARYQDKLREHFNALVPENAGKWIENEFTQNSPWHPQLDKIIDFADDNGKRLRMHNLIWDNQQPNWVNTLLNSAAGGNQTAKNQLRAAISNRIDYYVEDMSQHYYEVDVYNEMDHTPKYWNAYGASGIADIYNEVAAAAGPNVRIATNEYNVFQDTGDFYGNWYKNKIEEVIAADGAVSAIGIQSYENNWAPGDGCWCSHWPARKMQTLQNLSVLGLPITLTEFGIKSGTSPARTVEIMEDVMRLMFGSPNSTGFYMWGFWAGDIWSQAPAAALYDTSWNLTAAGQLWNNLMDEWTTQETTVVGPNGTISFDGFWGDYDITVEGETFELELVKGTTAYSLLVGETLQGDFNLDGIVDAADYAVWRNHLGDTDETNISFNGDGGDIGLGDYAVWKSQYGNTAPGAGGLAAAVPEPTAVALLLIALGLVSKSRRR
jgi:GH35 family endo-1,4-beta-xylanase